jgi:hypothetical protein
LPYYYKGSDGSYGVSYATSRTAEVCPASAPNATSVPTQWRNNSGEDSWSTHSLKGRVIGGTGYATNLPYKIVDGLFSFQTFSDPSKCITTEGRDICQGWNGGSGQETLIFDVSVKMQLLSNFENLISS